jgi:hypothetical protein
MMGPETDSGHNLNPGLAMCMGNHMDHHMQMTANGTYASEAIRMR